MLINVLGLNFLLAAKEIAMATKSITNFSQLTEAARLVVVGRGGGGGGGGRVRVLSPGAEVESISNSVAVEEETAPPPPTPPTPPAPGPPARVQRLCCLHLCERSRRTLLDHQYSQVEVRRICSRIVSAPPAWKLIFSSL